MGPVLELLKSRLVIFLNLFYFHKSWCNFFEVLGFDVYSVAFAVALQSVGARVNTIFYPDKTHTDLFLQVCIFSCVIKFF